jgi:hypothetical protein
MALTIFSRKSVEYGFIAFPIADCFTVPHTNANRCKLFDFEYWFAHLDAQSLSFRRSRDAATVIV